MKQLRKAIKDLHKTLNDMHSVKLRDGTEGMCIDWEVRISVVDVNGKGKVIATTDDIVKVVRKHSFAPSC